MPDPKITFGEMRESGTHGILVGCNACGRHAAIDAGAWGDTVRLSDIEPQFVCKSCGAKGATVRPDFAPARMGTSYR